MSATTERASILALMEEAWPGRHRAKRAAAAAKAPVATAKAWLAGRFLPSAETLLRMADADDAMADALERRIRARRDAREAAAPAGAAAAVAGAEER